MSLKFSRRSSRRHANEKHFQLASAIAKSAARRRAARPTLDENTVSRVLTITDRVSDSGRYCIFITNQGSANQLETLIRHEICAVLTLGNSNQLCDNVVRDVEYLVVDAEDLRTSDNVQDLRQRVLPAARAFLSTWLPRGNVLVHCSLGKCRSPLAVLDYLLNACGVDIETAAAAVTQQRPLVNSDPTLLQTLFK